jgi:alanine racemase
MVLGGHMTIDGQTDFMPNNVTIDLSALIHNLNQVRKLIDRNTKIMGVVKSDAYGHGLIPVSQILEKNRIDCLGVSYLYEALELRKAGIRVPIVILCGIQTREESRQVVENELTPVLFDLTVAEILMQESARLGKKTPIHLKVDTGMGRLGISHKEIGPFLQRIMTLKHLDIKAIMSHLSSADDCESDFTDVQISKFEEVIQVARSMGLDLPFNNLANSAGIMAYKRAHFGMVRPGIMLYGGLTSPEFKSPVPLRPVMHLKGKVLQIRDLKGQTPVSYGRTYHTDGPCRIAILSAGYADGLPRSMSNRGRVLISEKKVPIIGTVCMNLTICDTTGLEDISTGDEAVFLGSQGQKTITGDDMAVWAGTISYEIFCSIGGHNKKAYLS